MAKLGYMATVKVKVGEFRNHLSAYLKKVRQGREFIITDRDTPIGVVIPFPAREEEEESFDFIPPAKGFEGLAACSFSFIPTTVDPVELLLEDRRRR